MINRLIMMVLSAYIAVGMVATVAAEDGFGRMFSRPAEREKLDNLRKNQQLKVSIMPEKNVSEDAENTVSMENTDPITLQGYVKRSDGVKSTLWINNKPVQEDEAVDNVQVGRINHRGFSNKTTNNEGIDVQVTASGKKVRLKAGQMYEPETSQIKELQIVEKAKRLKLKEAGVIGGDA